MHVSRIGLTPLKGARHLVRPQVELDSEGPLDDRTFALVDRDRGRVVRTVDHGLLSRVQARLDGDVLRVELPQVSVAAVPRDTGEVLEVDYWGRQVEVCVVAGGWSAALSEHLGREVVLTRAVRRGALVYGAPVSLVTTSSLRRLGAELAGEPDSARFRATFCIDGGGDAPPWHEEDWLGRRVRVGGAVLDVHSVVARCAVVDRDPGTGAVDLPVLKALDLCRPAGGVRLGFGVDARVAVPGTVRTGDPVVLVGH